MTIELTDQQQQALNSSGEQPPRVVDPRTEKTYVLVPADEYERMRELFEDEREQRIIRQVGQQNLIRRMLEEGE